MTFYVIFKSGLRLAEPGIGNAAKPRSARR